MHTIRLDIKDSVFDKVMFLLNSLPKNEVVLKVETSDAEFRSEESLVDFFRNSPLKGELELERDHEYYTPRTAF